MSDCWKWPESDWTSETLNWKTAKMITAGIDVGTTSSQAAVLCDGQLFGYANIRTSANFADAADTVIRRAMGSSGMTLKDVGAAVSTGWGCRNVSYAHKSMDEVHCHAKGARFIFGPEVRTVVDLGGQTCKAIRLYDWDRVRDFMMNDKCATGFGRNIEVICDLLQIPIEEIGEKSLDVKADPEPVSTTCYNFADTETMGLFRPEFRADPLTENEVYASHLFAVAWRILGVIGKLQPLDVGNIMVYKELGFTGGLAKNKGITRRLERELNVTALKSRCDPQLAGAIGAALLA
jgi:benzoyl-CoA reductase subunit A